MLQRLKEKDGAVREVKVNTDIITITGISLFEEVSLNNNPGLTKEDLETIIAQARQRIIGKVSMAFFLGITSEELIARLIINMPKLKRCIIRIGPDRVWLPLPIFVYFKGDPRLN